MAKHLHHWRQWNDDRMDGWMGAVECRRDISLSRWHTHTNTPSAHRAWNESGRNRRRTDMSYRWLWWGSCSVRSWQFGQMEQMKTKDGWIRGGGGRRLCERVSHINMADHQHHQDVANSFDALAHIWFGSMSPAAAAAAADTHNVEGKGVPSGHNGAKRYVWFILAHRWTPARACEAKHFVCTHLLPWHASQFAPSSLGFQ